MYKTKVNELAKKIMVISDEPEIYMHLLDSFFETVLRVNEKLLTHETQKEKTKATYSGQDLVQELNYIENSLEISLKALITKMNILNRVSNLFGIGEIFPFDTERDLKKQALYFLSCLMQEAKENF